MSVFDAFNYQGKRAVVVGGATGMGAAAAELLLDAGAELVVMDRAEVTLAGAKAVHVDMSDTASIDAAVAEIGGPVHALFSCAGVADGTPGIEKINFLGHRYMIERLLDADLLPQGSSIGLISSFAGIGWEGQLDLLNEYLAIGDVEEASRWAHEHGKADYMWSKRAINAYVSREAFGLLKRGIRINAILPGPTRTPLAEANADTWLRFGTDYRAELGIEPSTPMEQACALVFLCSDAAAAIAGVTLYTDVGYLAAGVSGAFEEAAGAVEFMRSI